jgi:hypothetical protein
VFAEVLSHAVPRVERDAPTAAGTMFRFEQA